MGIQVSNRLELLPRDGPHGGWRYALRKGGEGDLLPDHAELEHAASVEGMTNAVMSNHFHLLVRVHDREKFRPAEVTERKNASWAALVPYAGLHSDAEIAAGQFTNAPAILRLSPTGATRQAPGRRGIL